MKITKGEKECSSPEKSDLPKISIKNYKLKKKKNYKLKWILLHDSGTVSNLHEAETSTVNWWDNCLIYEEAKIPFSHSDNSVSALQHAKMLTGMVNIKVSNVST